MRNITGTGDRHALAFDGGTATLEHFLGEVHATEAGGLRADQAAAVARALAGQHAGELVAQALVLTEQEADLTGTDTDVASRHVDIGADVTVQLAHESLAEAHDFGVALAFGVEIRTTLATAHGQRRQRVLEGLLEGEELQDSQIHRRMETQATLVRADGAVHLDTETAIDLHLAVIVDPGHAEHDGPLRLADALKNAGAQVMRIGFKKGPQATQHFFDGLMKFRLVRVAFFQAGKEGVDGFDHGKSLGKFIVVGIIEPDFNKPIAHRNSAECRICEIKWCTGYKSTLFSRCFCTQTGMPNSSFAPSVSPLPQGNAFQMWERACSRRTRLGVTE
ncbi:hypothetical protein D3C76_949540 [compost metagenome]